ncbi:MFS family permease [Streptosporangium becharense]|uniref:MFS family permease n=1 Tax=Streptosporangium becharense TaxID=1816182 RepID=A0A7W9IHV0_9ACTN|nr:MFS transporter [Streptosporangium becharense]MBB2914801.1 MFS family permease [Streptosporangium becharense]MBB5820388.1 MFS family permease [Streptosporangium becharense]
MHDYRRDLDMFRDRRFTLLLAARTISMLGSSFAPVALAFGILGLPGATPTTLSIVLTAEALPMVVFMLVGGVIADRLPRHRVMMAGEVLNAAAFSSLAAMMLTGWTPLPALAVAAALTGVGMAVLYPALTGIIPDVVPAERLQTANALLGLGGNSARVAGLVLSGGAVVALGGGWSLAVSGAMFATAAVLVAGIRLTPAERSASESHSVLADLRGGWREFVSRQWLWVVVAQFSVLVMAVQAAHGVLGPLVATESLGGAGAWAAVLAGEAVGMIGGVFVALRLRPRRPILFATILTVPTALPYVLLGSGAPLWAIVLGAVVMGVCFDVFGVLWSTTMQREIPPESLSRVSSYDALGSLMLGPVGLMVAGPLAIAVGPEPALLGCAALVVLSSLAALLSPGVRNLRAPETVLDGTEDAPSEPVPADAPSVVPEAAPKAVPS